MDESVSLIIISLKSARQSRGGAMISNLKIEGAAHHRAGVSQSPTGDAISGRGPWGRYVKLRPS